MYKTLEAAGWATNSVQPCFLPIAGTIIEESSTSRRNRATLCHVDVSPLLVESLLLILDGFLSVIESLLAIIDGCLPIAGTNIEESSTSRRNRTTLCTKKESLQDAKTHLGYEPCFRLGPLRAQTLGYEGVCDQVAMASAVRRWTIIEESSTSRTNRATLCAKNEPQNQE